MNDYVNECRSNPYGANSLKKRNQKQVYLAILEADRREKLHRIYKYPVRLKITWYEPNKRRDVDNITFAVKFILDELVKERILQNDSQKYVCEIWNSVRVDKLNPRIEVEIEGIE